MKTIDLNDQQVLWLKELIEAETKDESLSKTWKAVMLQILSKLENE